MGRRVSRHAESGPPLRTGDRLFIRCDGGPCISRLVTYPPPLEIADSGGLYVLNDDGPQHDWVYFWLATDM